MQGPRFSVAVTIERARLHHRWATERWRPIAVEVTASSEPQIETLRDDGDIAQWRIGGHTVELHPTEAEGYFLNLSSPAPCVFVMWRLHDDDIVPAARPVVVTVSYNEAGRLLDGGERVDNVPIPEAIAAALQPFVAAHYKPEPRRKVKRNDPLGDEQRARDVPK